VFHVKSESMIDQHFPVNLLNLCS